MDFNIDTINDGVDDFLSGNLNPSFAAPKPQFVLKRKSEEREVIDHKRKATTSDYASKHRVKEEKLLANQTFNAPSTSFATVVVKVSDEDSDDETSTPTIKKEDPDLPNPDVSQRYRFDLKPQKLPILEKRELILSKIETNRVVILSSATGSGKSTQVPQYILERAYERNENCNIVVTQPKRIGGK